MARARGSLLFLAAAVLGVVVTLSVTYLARRPEPWDTPHPLAWLAILSAIFGFLEPQRPWRWGLATMLLQPVFVFLPEVRHLWPTALLFLGICTLPCMVAGWLGAAIRRQLPPQNRR